ncbi:MAG: hypothetical protein M3R62_04530 [Acidobacteriota bacterium]|nr:hypothetical protein [Acidobacteriota bacterium]MDQ2978463.1 hypothetical protein [Acidobacteriota bacterium]
MEATSFGFALDEDTDSASAGLPTKPWYAIGKAVFDGSGEAIAAARSVDDGRRIAAALNAVIGMPTEALEAWSLGSIQDPTNDLLAQLESVLAPPASEDRRGADRRQGERRRAITEVRVQTS